MKTKTLQNSWPCFRSNIQHTVYYIGNAPEKLTELKWKFKTESVVRSRPVVAEGMVFFGSTDGYLYAVIVKTGQEMWKFKIEGEVASSPAVAEGMVFSGSIDNNNMYAVK